ncbi:thioredoxin family protein [Halodesulfovibrio marinisediminis]|uniref:Thioredoxin 1 n=1 Tax=Halodesulfovibrio marinisediminis DSM 17456 TaxID=1121457 RepID=A0A1N6IKD7_9BACT|nr:thioredoxin family protein [Halodesulfovibrio marinisediminis]SIO32467.1 thioredoxin 1 [Halodesulfovibrio marinisediminis DSM 17456]
MSAITPIPNEHIENFFASLTDAILFFHKEQCPHCKNMEKVLEKFSTKTPSVEFFSIDCEKHPELQEKLSFYRVPTIAFVRNGEVIKVHTGLMNPRELKTLYTSL